MAIAGVYADPGPVVGAAVHFDQILPYSYFTARRRWNDAGARGVYLRLRDDPLQKDRHRRFLNLAIGEVDGRWEELLEIRPATGLYVVAMRGDGL